MSSLTENPPKTRPFSADVSRNIKVRLQTSNCPTILKHEVTSPAEDFRAFTHGSDKPQLILDRPRTTTNSTKQKLAFLQSLRPVVSPMSASSMRPLSGVVNSTINFDFLSNIGKVSNGKFQDQSKIKPVKKLKTDSFHNVIYKVKQQKESLEKDINRMEQWHKDFKENDLWSTPQSAIVESILKHNARSNPEGNISRFLQNEKEHKEKEEMVRLNKRFERPMSAYAHLSKSRTPLNARSVQDFFINVDNDEEIIEEIIGAKKHYKTQYETNKRKITEKINNYVDNVGIYGASGQNIGTSQFRLPRETKEKNLQIVNIDNFPGNSINEIVDEDVETSPRYRLDNMASNPSFFDSKAPHRVPKQAKNRPYSAKVAINTTLTPKNFTSGILIPNITQGIPAAINTRPQTAKLARFTPTASLTNGFAVNGDMRQQSVPNIKFIPFMMEGQRMQIEPYNTSMQKFATNQTNSSKASSMREDNPKVTSSSKQLKTTLSNASFKQNQENGSEREGIKIRRPMTAKPSLKTSAATQTLVIEGPAIGKVNIDGEYFQTFSQPGSVNAQSRKNVLESWTSKDNQPRGQIMEREF